MTYDDIDPNGDFLRVVLGQCTGLKKVFFNNPSETLPALFEFLFVLYAVDAHFSRELTGTVLVNLLRLPEGGGGGGGGGGGDGGTATTTPAYSRTAALSALSAALPALFCKRALGMPLVRHTKEQLFRAVLAQFPNPQAVDFAIKFLFLARAHHASWQAFSRLAYAPAQALVQPSHLHTPKDLWRLCSLWAVISPKGFTRDSWLKILNDSKGNPSSSPSSLSPREEGSNAQPLISTETELGRVFEALGLRWIPAFLVTARHALTVPAEALPPPSDDGNNGSNNSNNAEEENSMISGVAGAAVSAVRRYAAAPWCTQLPGVAEAVAIVAAAAEKLIWHMTSALKSPTVSTEVLSAILKAFESVLEMGEIVAVVKPVGSLVRLLSSLCPGGSATALLFYHSFLAKKFAAVSASTVSPLVVSNSGCSGSGGREETERASRNARESVLNIWLLGELAYFLKVAPVPASEGDKPFTIDETVLAKLFQNRTYIKTKLSDLRAIFEDEANTDMILTAALRCITPSVTHRGARNLFFSRLQCCP